MSDVRVLVTGGRRVGKSALSFRFEYKEFIDDYNPTIEEHYRPQYMVDGVSYLISIVDVWSGEEEFLAMKTQAFRDCHVMLLVYDVTNRATFDELEARYEEARKWKDYETLDRFGVVIVGNKCDLASADVPAAQFSELLVHQQQQLQRHTLHPKLEAMPPVLYDTLDSFYQYHLLTVVKSLPKPLMLLVCAYAHVADERCVSTAEGRALAAKWNARFIETSAKLPINVEEAVSEGVRSWVVNSSKPQRPKSKAYLKECCVS